MADRSAVLHKRWANVLKMLAPRPWDPDHDDVRFESVGADKVRVTWKAAYDHTILAQSGPGTDFNPFASKAIRDAVHGYGDHIVGPGPGTPRMPRREPRSPGQERRRDEPGEPEEGDLVTYDHREVREVGSTSRRPALTVADSEDFNAEVRAYMDRQGWYPNVWFISDHGNAHLLGQARSRPKHPKGRGSRLGIVARLSRRNGRRRYRSR